MSPPGEYRLAVGGQPLARVEHPAPAFEDEADARSKYRYMEVNLQQRRKALSVKIPDIEQTLTVVRFLQTRRKKSLGEAVDEEVLSDDDDDDEGLDDGDDGKKGEPLKTLFELNDTLYAEAEVDETGQVGIWLGVSSTFRSLCSDTRFRPCVRGSIRSGRRGDHAGLGRSQGVTR